MATLPRASCLDTPTRLRTAAVEETSGGIRIPCLGSRKYNDLALALPLASSSCDTDLKTSNAKHFQSG